jgi:hypothetical protein
MKEAVNTLELEQDLAFERRQWRIQHNAWFIMGLIILAGLLGIFGDGALSHRHTAGVVRLSYEHFLRKGRTTTLNFFILSGAEVRIRFDEAYFERFKIEGIHPEPSRSQLEQGGYSYVFDTLPNYGLATAPLELILELRPQRFGFWRGVIAVNGQQLELRHWVFP